MDVALLRAAQELRRGRVDLVDHFDGDTRGAGVLAQCGAHGLGVEEIRRLEQTIPATLDPLEREAGRLGVLQHLRDAGARQPHLRGEVLTGVERPVR